MSDFASRLTLTVTGIKEMKYFLDIAPAITRQAARIAINDVARDTGMKLIRKSIYEQASFPAGYLEDPSRLRVSQLASDSNLQAVISARARATSLARFAGSASFPTPKNGGVSVTINPGLATRLPKAFLVRLRSGASLTEDNYNLGLAIRVKPGTIIRGKNRQSTVQLDHNVVLLYGPSVDQVFRDVAIEQEEPIAEMLEFEFTRQFTRLTAGI